MIINDYKDLKKYYLNQYKDKPKFYKFLDGSANEMNECEIALDEMTLYYNIDYGEGVQLDKLGKIIGLERNGRDDNSYRTLLKVKSSINFSSGTPSAVIRTVRSLYNATKVEYREVYPAGVQIWSDGDINITIDYDMSLDDTELLYLDNDDTLLVQLPDEISEQLLFDVLPVGVGLTITDELILDDGMNLYLDDNDFMLVS